VLETLGSMDTAQAAIRESGRHGNAERWRFAELCALGVSKNLAAKTAGSAHGPWRIGQQPRLNIAFPHRLLEALWSSQVVRWSLAQSVRTAGCGPACPVVWQGRRGDSPPYADCLLI